MSRGTVLNGNFSLSGHKKNVEVWAFYALARKVSVRTVPSDMRFSFFLLHRLSDKSHPAARSGFNAGESVHSSPNDENG